MEHAIILDKEEAFARALGRSLQLKFPTLIWTALSTIKDLYRHLDALSVKPRLVLYSAAQFPEWTPTWSCQSLVLREHPLYQDLFHTYLPALEPYRQVKGNPVTEVYRLDTKAIEAELRLMFGSRQLDSSMMEMQLGKLHALVSDLSGRRFAYYLNELFNKNMETGLRTLVLPFVDISKNSVLQARLSEPADGSDIASLLMRLGREVLLAEQLYPYMFPTQKPGILSFVPAADSWQAEHASIVAVRQLLALLKTLIRKQSTQDTALVICSKSASRLLRQVLPICDELFILNNAEALRNPSIYRQSEDLKALLPPGFPISERCV